MYSGERKKSAGDDISERLLDFAVRVIKLVNVLPKTVVGRHIAGQLVRSGTSCGSNYEEARGAESRADFVHRFRYNP
jgi:four helix bundle protein